MNETDLLTFLCETTDLTDMNNAELFEAIRVLESTYRPSLPAYSLDHRRHLSRPKLEIVFSLAQRVVRPRINSLHVESQIGSSNQTLRHDISDRSSPQTINRSEARRYSKQH